jgi:hypothetical protein
MPVLGTSAPASAFPNATIINQTRKPVTGTIHYAACRPDNFSLPAGTEAKGLGPAFPYTSSGTAKSRFIIAHNENGLVVVDDEVK